MKEIIERAERLGYVPILFDDQSPSLKISYEQMCYIELFLIQKWLREEKGIYVFIDDYGFVIQINGVGVVFEGMYIDDVDKALEEGIKKALEILEKL